MGYDYEYADPMNIIEYSLKVYTPPPPKKKNGCIRQYLSTML